MSPFFTARVELCSRCQQCPRQPSDSYCHPCRQAYTRNWRAQHVERMRELRAAERRRKGMAERKPAEPRSNLRVSLRAIRRVLEVQP